MEIMLNTPLIADLIFKGEVADIKDLMKRSRELGMQTFDQALFDLYETNMVTYEDALRNADSVNDLRLQIKLNSQRARTQDLAAICRQYGVPLLLDAVSSSCGARNRAASSTSSLPAPVPETTSGRSAATAPCGA